MHIAFLVWLEEVVTGTTHRGRVLSGRLVDLQWGEVNKAEGNESMHGMVDLYP